jgi:hypothetical protein
MNPEELIAQANPKALVLEPRTTFNRAIVGVTSDGRLCYSEDKILGALQEIDGMDYEEALDYYSFNTVRSLAYEKAKVAPVILTSTL